MAKNYQPLDVSLQEAVTGIGEGSIRLPEFQRDFNWAPADQRSLLDSIQKKYPVGTLLLLEMVGEETAGPFGQRPFTGVTSPAKPAKYLVLDGQQRLSTCYRAFSHDSAKMFCIDLGELFRKTGGRSRVEIDLADLILVRSRPVHPENLLYNRNLLPFEFLRDRDSLRERLATYRANLMSQEETKAFGTFVDVYLEGYVDVFFDYTFPAVVLPSTLDVVAVASIFTKINTSGLRLSAFDLCVASLVRNQVPLREMWRQARESDAVVALDRDGTNLLQTVALLAGKPPKKAALVKNIEKAHIDAYWTPAVDAVKRAAALLAQVGAPDSSTIPYDAMIPALAAALAKTLEPATPPERGSLRRKIARWVQQTAFLQRYNEGTDVKQSADFPAVVTWLSGGPEPAFLRDTVVWQGSWQRLARAGARYRAIVALLNAAEPHDLIETDKTLGKGVAGRYPAQLHHLFPRAYLAGKGYKNADIDLALNISFLTAESNNFISDRAPSLYLHDRIQALVAGGLTKVAAENQVRGLLAGHLVNESGWDAMLLDDYEAFLEARAEEVRHRLTSLGIPVAVAKPEDATDEDGSEEEVDPTTEGEDPGAT